MKHLLNNLTEEEKNSIREQHTGGKKIIIENFSKLINTKSGEVKTYLNEQAKNHGFYDELKKHGYEANQIWTMDENLYSQIKPATVPLNGGNADTVIYFEKPISTLKTIRFITDGEKFYFLKNEYGDGRFNSNWGLGPHVVNEKTRNEFKKY